jgi:hypothetical protein
MNSTATFTIHLLRKVSTATTWMPLVEVSLEISIIAITRPRGMKIKEP